MKTIPKAQDLIVHLKWLQADIVILFLRYLPYENRNYLCKDLLNYFYLMFSQQNILLF